MGSASFTSNPNELMVTQSDGTSAILKAENILVATGGFPSFPSGEGVKEVSERSERALRKTSILVMNPAKWLQT